MPDAGFPQFDELYREIILDHYRRPRGRKPVSSPDIENEGFNPVCGDEVKIALKFEAGKVKEVSVVGRGCAISTASGSILAELLPGKSTKEAAEIVSAFKGMMHDEKAPEGLDLGDLDALQGVKKYPVRIKCALLSWVTLADALKAWAGGQHHPEASSTTEERASGEL
jgi:nitrogen fixation NifU-like protein